MAGWLRARLSRRPVRDLFLTLLVIAVVSVLFTCHVTRFVTAWLGTSDIAPGWNIRFKGHVEIYRRVGATRADANALEGTTMRGDGRRRAWTRGRGQIPRELSRRLKEIESSSLSGRLLRTFATGELGEAEVRKVAVLFASASRQDAALYRKALKKADFSVLELSASQLQRLLHNQTQEILRALDAVRGFTEQRASDEVSLPAEWTLLLCQDEDTCAQLAQYRMHSQKLSWIPDLKFTLSHKDVFCETMTKYRHIPVLRDSPLSPSCFLFPTQYQNLLSEIDSSDHQRSKWLFGELHSNHREIVFESIDARETLRKMRQWGVVQKCASSPLLLYGRLFTVEAFVFVTSLSPLRAYVHADGLVQQRHTYEQDFRKIEGATWTLDQLSQYMRQTYDDDAAATLFTNMNSAIVQTLLLAESASKSSPRSQRCDNCFQLLSVELLFNGSLHPSVLQVRSQPDLGQLIKVNIWNKMVVRGDSIVDDMVAMLTASTPVATEVAIALGELSRDVAIAQAGCPPAHKVCLSQAEARYLLAWRAEVLHKGRFQQLYPCTESDKYSRLLAALHATSPPTGAAPGGQTVNRLRTTAGLHAVLVGVAKFYHALDSVDESYDDFNIPWYPELQVNPSSRDETTKLVENIFYNSSQLDDKYIRQSCSKDKRQMSYLQGFDTEPKLGDISPAFSATVNEYYATVPYDVFLIKLWAFAASCYSEARLETKYGLARPSNYTLGLGSNRIVITVVDLTHTEPWLINTYTVYVHRQGGGTGRATGGAASRRSDVRTARVCSLEQDCQLLYAPSSPCGLQPAAFHNWKAYDLHTTSLPSCTSADVPGKWFVPCRNCSDNRSCHWNVAEWQPELCRHRRVPRDKLKKCLAGKQLLFIGDSTNRGMMHYVMEQVNGTLSEWDKTHNSRVYTNLNAQRTAVSFLYYPQFWLPASQRPVFDKALYQLMKLSLPLENNHNTVLIVGGVHWLATHHLTVILKALKRENLSNIKLVVKGLGAGFHQPVDGLHCLTVLEQRKLLIHNAGLADYARRHHFHVIETYNMTMARYKDFLQGKCACHFHRVKDTLPSFTTYLRQGGGAISDAPIQYHVEGDINAAYSELLLNTICTYS